MFAALLGRTPKNLLAMITLGVALTTASFAALIVLSWSLPPEQRLSYSTKLPWIFGLVLGFGFNFYGEHLLQRSLKQKRWPEATIARLRKTMEHTSWSAVTWVLFLGVFVADVFSPIRHDLGFTCILLTPVNAITRIRSSLKQISDPASASHRNALFPAKRLQSAHWGEASGSARN